MLDLPRYRLGALKNEFGNFKAHGRGGLVTVCQAIQNGG